jgi:hypothetical protein
LGSWFLYRGGTDIGSYPALKDWDHHIRIERTRADPNTFRLYHNGSLAIEGIALVPDGNYSYFNFQGTRGASIDNINIEFEPEIPISSSTTTTSTTEDPTTTPDPTDPPDMTMILMIAGGGAAVIVVIAIVLKMRS